MLKHARNTEITDFNLSRLRHKDVLSLEISMQYLPIVYMLDGQCHLHEPIQNLILTVANYTDNISNDMKKLRICDVRELLEQWLIVCVTILTLNTHSPPCLIQTVSPTKAQLF